MFNIFDFLIKKSVFCDAPEPWQLGFQDPATPTVEGMIFFHNYLMIFLIIIGFFVCWMLYKVIIAFNEDVIHSNIDNMLKEIKSKTKSIPIIKTHDCNIDNIEDKINCFSIENYGCPNPNNLNDLKINSGILPYYIEVPDNNVNSPFNKKCVFCWNLMDNI
jgi:hypothetical protein